MCLKSGSDNIDLMFKPTGKLKLRYINNNIDHDWHSSSKEATNVAHPEISNRCDTLPRSFHILGFQLNTTSANCASDYDEVSYAIYHSGNSKVG